MKDVDVPASEPEVGDTNIEATTGTSSQNLLTVNKNFIVNTLKQVDDHNRIKSTQDSKLLRKVQNEQRKKLTKGNLNRFAIRKTLYSDLILITPGKGKGKGVKRTNIISPLDQVKKLVSDAADFDLKQETKMKRAYKPRIQLDKTLLNNHLRHTAVHNRLQEESDMWDQHESGKKKNIQLYTKKAKAMRRAGPVGGMYADREPGNVKVTRVKATSSNEPPRFGIATRQLLDLEESMPDRWGHSGFKETYEDELSDFSETDTPSNKISRTIVVSDPVVDRLNSSIELSDDEDFMVKARTIKRTIAGNVVVKKVKRTLTSSPRKITVNKQDVPIKKKSVITIAPKPSRVKLAAKPKPKKVSAGRNIGTLQSDMILVDERRQNRSLKREVSPKWAHDGFQEIIDDSDDNEVDVDLSVKRSAKSRLGAVHLSDDDSVVSTDSLKMNAQRRKIIAVKNEIKQRTKSKGGMPNKKKVEIISPVQISDSEEWTEKEVTRVTLKNSIHEETSKSVKSRLGQKRKVDTNEDAPKRINRNRTLSKGSGDSSFSDSSGDERYKKVVDIRKKRAERFSSNKNR